MLLNTSCCCGAGRSAAERLVVTLVRLQKALICTRTRTVRTVTSLAMTTNGPVVTRAFLLPQPLLLSRPRQVTPKPQRRVTLRTPGLQAQTHIHLFKDHIWKVLHEYGKRCGSSGTLGSPVAWWKELCRWLLLPTKPCSPDKVPPRSAAAPSLSSVDSLRVDHAVLPAASSGRIHTGHHDGCAGGDGLRGPTPKPTAAEQIQLQPAGRRQRARSDERQWLVFHPLLNGGGQQEQGILFQERKREVIPAHQLFYLSRSAHLPPVSST